MKTYLLAGAIFALAACASVNDAGWAGENAQPFDSARAACEIEAQGTRGAEFEACMASKGWTRPQ
jgi:hypothetical protein